MTQLVAEKHRTRFTARHSLLEYNPHLATERILEEDEKVVEVRMTCVRFFSACLTKTEEMSVSFTIRIIDNTVFPF